jgi:hypothetical protein
MRVYLDNCALNRPFDDQRQIRNRLESEAKLEIQKQIRGGLLQLVWSYMIDFENSANPFEERRNRIHAWSALASAFVSSSPGLVARAEELHLLGFKKKDSLHLACAETSSCDRFITTDDGILRKRGVMSNLLILNPIEFVTGNP